MKKRILLLIALAFLAGLACGCVIPGTPESAPSPGASPAPPVAVPLSIQINATPPRYNLAMSSTIGIRLEPVNTSGFLPEDSRFTWETSYGSFYHWGPPDFRVTELGPRYTGTGEPVYWSFFSLEGEKERPPVNITLTVQGPSTGDILAKASLKIGWEDPHGFTAIVEG
ncbi:MAG: hypothetical protein ABSD81_04195 [Methanomicrobiales archaeon]|jgi:hypothetical protein